MSRWTQGFNSHPFQTHWSALKARLAEATVADSTIVTDIEELARLKKVIAHVDGIMKALDPDLVPPSIWTRFNEQVTNADHAVALFISNGNISHIQQANDHADNLLSYVRPHMVATGRVAKSLRDAVSAYSQAMAEQAGIFQENARANLKEIADIAAIADAHAKTIGEGLRAIQLARDEVVGADGESGLLGEIVDSSEKLKEIGQEIRQAHSVLLVGSEEAPSVKRAATEALDQAKSDQSKIAKILERVESLVGDLSGFHEQVFGNTDEDGVAQPGLKDEVNNQKRILSEIEEHHRDRYKAIADEIETLLPGATSAGLSTAYRDMKRSFDWPIRLYGAAFYVVVIVLAAVSFATFFSPEHGLKAPPPSDWTEVLRGLAQKLPFYLAMVWLAYFVSKRRSENQRLRQEYAHKESIASSYESYRRQVEALGVAGEELRPILLRKAIDAIAKNASDTLDGKHGDKVPSHEAVEKVVLSLVEGMRRGE